MFYKKIVKKMETRIKVTVRLESNSLPAHAVVREMHLAALRRRIAPVICKYFEILYTDVYEQCKVSVSQNANDSKTLVVNKSTLLPEIQKRLISADYFEKSVRCRMASDLIASSADPGGVEFIECVFSVFHSTLHLLAAADGRIGESHFNRKLNGAETQANYFQTTPNCKESTRPPRKNTSVRIEERENKTVELSSRDRVENTQDGTEDGGAQEDHDDSIEDAKKEEPDASASSGTVENRTFANSNNNLYASQSFNKRRNLALMPSSSKSVTVDCAKTPQFCVLGCTVGALVSEVYSAAARRLFNNPFLLLQDVGAQVFVERHAKCLLEIEQAVDQCVYDSALIMLRRLREKTMFATLENFPSQLNYMNKFASAVGATTNQPQCTKSESSVAAASADQNTDSNDASTASLASAMTVRRSDRGNRNMCLHSQTSHSNESSPALPLIVTPSPFATASRKSSTVSAVPEEKFDSKTAKSAHRSERSGTARAVLSHKKTDASASHSIMHIPLSDSMARNLNCAVSAKADSSAAEEN